METIEQNLNYATSVITNLAPAREIENEEKILYKTIEKNYRYYWSNYWMYIINTTNGSCIYSKLNYQRGQWSNILHTKKNWTRWKNV